MKKVIIIFYLLSKVVFSYINIYPTSFDKRIDGDGGYQEFTVVNNTSEKIMYRVYIEPYAKENNMDIWANFYPKSFILNPGEEEIVKLSIASYGEIPKGEYFCILGIREIPIFEREIKDEKNLITIHTDLKLVLTGYAGDIKPVLEIENLELFENEEKIFLKGKIKNIGERLGKYKLYLGENFLGNLKIKKGETINMNGDFFLLKELKNIKKNTLIFKDYETNEEILKVNL